jgi:hypothetical protein
MKDYTTSWIGSDGKIHEISTKFLANGSFISTHKVLLLIDYINMHEHIIKRLQNRGSIFHHSKRHLFFFDSDDSDEDDYDINDCKEDLEDLNVAYQQSGTCIAVKGSNMVKLFTILYSKEF